MLTWDLLTISEISGDYSCELRNIWLQDHCVMRSSDNGNVQSSGCELSPTEIRIVVLMGLALVLCFARLDENDAAGIRRRSIVPNKLNSRLTTSQPMLKIFYRYFSR